MVTDAPTSRRDRIAIASSIAFHCCVLAGLATLPGPTFQADVPDERAILSQVVRIERRPPQHVRQPPHRAPAVPAATRPVAPPVVHVAVTVEHAARTLVVASEHRYAPPIRHVANGRTRSARPAPETAPRTKLVAQAAAVASAAPPAPADATPVPAQHQDGIGNFDETYPAALDPQLRGTIFAGIAGPFVIRVSVDEDGRATGIEVIRAPSDPQALTELRTRLLAAHWIPAACNGLRCPGTVELHN